MAELSGSALRRPTPAGRHPGMAVARQVTASAGRSGAVWGVIFAGYVVGQTFAYVAAYKTQASRDQLADAFGTNIGVNALIGPARAINTVAGYASWRALGVLSLLGGVWGLSTATRLLRGEEESGRYELLLAGQTTPRRAGAQALAGLGVGLVALFVPTAIGLVAAGRAASVGFTAGQSLYFAVTLVSGAACFLALGALTSQLVNTRRQAATIAAIGFGSAYALRMVADSDPNLHWVVWLSPLGWIEQSRPLTDPQPWALLPVLGLVIAAAAATAHLAGTRDVGSAALPDHDSSPPHLMLLSGPTAQAARLMRPVVLGWLFAVTAFAVLVGTVASSATKALSGSNSITRAVQRLSGPGTLVAAYLGLTFLILGVLIALLAAGQIAAIRDEEAEGRLENIVVRPVSRLAWLAGRLWLSTCVILLAGLLAGLGAWLGAASQHSRVGLSSLLAAGLNIVPPALLLLGLGTIVIGGRPRRAAAVVYGYLVWSFLIEFLGAVLHANHWLLDTSVFLHMAPAPATSPHWGSAAVVTGLGLAGVVIGALLLRRRDLLGG